MTGEYIGPATFYNDFEMIFPAIIAFVLGVFIGYFFGNLKRKKPEIPKGRSSELSTNKRFDIILQDSPYTGYLSLVCEASFSRHIIQPPIQTRRSYGYERGVYHKIIIGRETDCDICVSVGDVSRHHCEIQIENGDLVVRRCEDNLTNAVYLNERTIVNHPLKAGDTLRTGSVTFFVKEVKVEADKITTDGLAENQSRTVSIRPIQVDNNGELETK